MRRVISTSLALGVLLSPAPAQPERPDSGVVVSQTSPLAIEVERFTADTQALRRFYDAQWSTARLDRFEAFYEQELDRLLRTPAPSDLNARIDRLLLINTIEQGQAAVSLDRARLEEMRPLVPFAGAVERLVAARLSMEPVPPEEAAVVLAQIAGQAEKLVGTLKDKQQADARPTATVALRASRAVGAMRRDLRNWNSLYAGFDPVFDWWCAKPAAEADAALADLERTLRVDIAQQKGEESDPLVGDPIGRGALVDALRLERIAYTPEALIEIGRRELRWCRDRMIEAAGEMGLGDDWQAALEEVKRASVGPGEQDDLVRDLSREGLEFVRDQDLVTVPALAEELWRLEMLSPSQQRVLPFAAYGGLSVLVASPSAQQTLEERVQSQRGNNRHFTRLVAFHELVPGHHLERFVTDRHLPHRGVFRTPFYTEGWALGWEMLMWDEGYAKSPEDRMGMLFWRKHRAARIVVSLLFHLDEMTPDEMVDYLVEEVGHEPLMARGEVRRFIGEAYGPLYQCAYLIGGIQVDALRREVVGPGGMTMRGFHDAVLACGPIPIEAVRWTLLGEAPPEPTPPGWRFDEARQAALDAAGRD